MPIGALIWELCVLSLLLAGVYIVVWVLLLGSEPFIEFLGGVVVLILHRCV